MNPSPIENISAGMTIITENQDGKYIAKEVEFKEISFVFEGADKNAKVLNSADISNWWDDPKLKEKAPKDYFLDPANRKYPYRTWDGEISCERLKAAMSLASLHGHSIIYARAKTLYENHCKEE